MPKICGTFDGYEGELGHRWGVSTPDDSFDQCLNTKLFFKKRCTIDQTKEIENALNEIALLNQLDHRNIQCLIGTFSFKPETNNFGQENSVGNFFTYSKLAEFGSVERIIATSFENGLPENIICCIISQIVPAVEYLHKRRIIHRSINARHILISSNGVARLSTYTNAICIDKCHRWIGVKDRVHDFDKSLNSVFIWLAPEILKQDTVGYGIESDVYSLGIIVCEMGNGFAPFCEMEPLQILYEKIRGSTPFLLDNTNSFTINNATAIPNATPHAQNSNRLETVNQHCQKTYSSEIHDFVTKCLAYNCEERPSCAQLISHKFLKSSEINNGQHSVEESLALFLFNNTVSLTLL